MEPEGGTSTQDVCFQLFVVTVQETVFVGGNAQTTTRVSPNTAREQTVIPLVSAGVNCILVYHTPCAVVVTSHHPTLFLTIN